MWINELETWRARSTEGALTAETDEQALTAADGIFDFADFRVE